MREEAIRKGFVEAREVVSDPSIFQEVQVWALREMLSSLEKVVIGVERGERVEVE